MNGCPTPPVLPSPEGIPPGGALAAGPGRANPQDEQREQQAHEAGLKRLREQTYSPLKALKMPGPLAEAYGGGLRAGDPVRS